MFSMLVSSISFIVSVALLLPALGVTMRRLHDIGKSGWWVLLGFVPLLGLILIYFLVLEGEVGENEFGENPKLGDYGK